jgi:hypothetical protein
MLLPAFMRPAGIVQIAFFRSISFSGSQPMISPVRAVVRIRSSSARAALPPWLRKSFMKAGSSS